MSKDISIKKGLDIKLLGEAVKTTTNLPLSSVYAVKPDDFHKVIPRLIKRVGDEVKAGEAIYHDKADENILFASPVSGEIIEVVRGERRKILAIKILADKEQRYQVFEKLDIAKSNAEEIKTYLKQTGCWPFIKRRPYDIIAKPTDEPKAIFISGYDSAPLAPDLDYVLQGKEAQLQAAISALAKLTTGKIHVGLHKNSKSPLAGLKGVEIHGLKGPHPVGNVGTQIAKIDPVNKGEMVWTVSPQDLVVIGEMLLTGKFNLTRTVALTGSSFVKTGYVKVVSGAAMEDIIAENVEKNSRIISGNVLSGEKVGKDGFLSYYSNQVTAIPEGDDYEFFGWNKPVFDKVSVTRALTFSWLQPNKKYDLTTNTNGEHRNFVLTGNYEEVFPLDIYPLQILKSCLYEDLDEMEALGMYEVAPEDFALTEFVCVSKQPHQQIIRKGLDLMIEEIG